MLHTPPKEVNDSTPCCSGDVDKARRSLDELLHAELGRFTAGVSPVALAQAYSDWAQHLLLSPDKQVEIAVSAQDKWLRYLGFCLRFCTDPACASCIDPLPHDKRFDDEAWDHSPFRLMYQGFLLQQQWWHNATNNVPGVSKHHEEVVSFVTRQLLDMVSPANFAATNPEVLKAIADSGGQNLARGTANLLYDWQRLVRNERPAGADDFEVGRNLAITPGKIVFRNRLIELVQYTPSTDKVHREPVLITPAWIMKYYILDLSPENSPVKYLIDREHTVFMISWKNPSGDDRDLGLEDYRKLGVMAALDAITAIAPDKQVHGVGYCLGGTLLSIAAAAMARDGDDRLATMTLLAAQTDFTEAGELTLFIDEAQVSFLEDIMASQGFLDSKQMAGAFQLLRSNDLIWSTMVRTYLMGEPQPIFDLMAWNADATRMPARMHSQYLRHLFLDNDLANERYIVGDRPVSLRDVRVPVFAVSTLSDHVAPWRSVYKIHAQTNGDVTFVLSSGGHNAGIVNPPGNSKRHHQIATHDDLATYVDPDSWQVQAESHEGSWWPCWQAWLSDKSGPLVDPPMLGNAGQDYGSICDAPGTYVFDA